MPYYLKKGTSEKYGVIGSCNINICNEWAEGVVYLADGQTYVRLKEDFEEKFEEEES